jgi:hypothetical protein
MPHKVLDLDLLEELRESGDYHKIAALMADDWQTAPAFADQAIRTRLLAAELAGRKGRLDEMEAALAPYLDDLDHVPFAYVARVLLASATYFYRRNEPSEALKLAARARSVAAAHDEERSGATRGTVALVAGTVGRSHQRVQGNHRPLRLAGAHVPAGSGLSVFGRGDESHGPG